jgi:hypothetical protein
VRGGLQKQFAVSIGEKDFLADVAPAGHMVNRAGKLQAKRTCQPGTTPGD